jgi:hypothetical protein
LDYVFAWRETRQVGGGSAIAYKKGIYVPKDQGISFEARTTVEVRETFGGEVNIWHKGEVVELRKVEQGRRKEDGNESKSKSAREVHKPAAEHSWRKGYQSGKQKAGTRVAGG